MSPPGRPNGEFRSAPHEGTPASAPRVLVVDDNLATIELTRFVLDAAGFEVDSTSDANNAGFLVSNTRPDLILMDIEMPGIDGLELTRQIKADPAMRHIVVIAFTAFAMKGDEAKLRRAGCDGYIAKPFDVSLLAATIRSYLPNPGGEAAGMSAQKLN